MHEVSTIVGRAQPRTSRHLRLGICLTLGLVLTASPGLAQSPSASRATGGPAAGTGVSSSATSSRSEQNGSGTASAGSDRSEEQGSSLTGAGAGRTSPVATGVMSESEIGGDTGGEHFLHDSPGYWGADGKVLRRWSSPR